MFCTRKKYIIELEVDNDLITYTIEVYSVPVEDIMCDFKVGRSLFQTNDELKINPGVIEINKIFIKAFITPDPHYPFLKMPFGLCIATLIFQRFIIDIMFRC